LQIPDTVALQHSLSVEIADLKRQAAALNHPDTFAQCAKAERKALSFEKELCRLQERRSQAEKSILIKFPGFVRTAAFLCLVGLALAKVPVVTHLRPNDVWPMGKWMSLLSKEKADVGAVGLVPWAILCNRATRAAVGVLR